MIILHFNERVVKSLYLVGRILATEEKTTEEKTSQLTQNPQNIYLRLTVCLQLTTRAHFEDSVRVLAQ